MSSACMDDTVLLTCYIPRGLPRVSILTLKNRLAWNGFRIRRVVFTALPPGEETLVFPIQTYVRSRLTT